MGSPLAHALLTGLVACILLPHYALALAGIDGALTTNATDIVSCRTRAATLCGPSSFTFYLHNIVYTLVVDNKENFTSVYGPPPNVTWPNPYSFGTTSTFEDPLTIGPSTTSRQIGIARGFWQLDSKIGYTLFHIFTANITEGKYKGTLDLFGQLREADPVRYMSVIGGTGAFLGARGLATCILLGIDHTLPPKWTLSFDLDLYY